MDKIAKRVVIFLLSYYICRTHSRNGQHQQIERCSNISAMPMWSWALTRQCCDIYPHKIGSHSYRYEGGDLMDNSYFHKKSITNGSIVYVASIDFPRFLRIFKTLPSSIRIVIVSGIEDIGVPWELFHSSRGEWSVLWGGKAPPITMRKFIEDSRLIRWYTQNYDLVGCNVFSCSDVKTNNTDDQHIIDKVVPIPIGMDFHTEAGKGVVLEDAAGMENNKGVCRQRHELHDLTLSLPVFALRPARAVAALNCNLPPTHKATRQEICAKLDSMKDKSYSTTNNINNNSINSVNSITYTSMNKREFWRSLGNHAFAITPAGHGMDTHRLWEVLNLHSVPITLTSPLDRLYEQYPVVIVKSWAEVFRPGALESFKRDIQTRFGSDPFASQMIREMLTVDYWAKQIRSSVKKT
eukprot:gene11623-24337_t